MPPGKPKGSVNKATILKQERKFFRCSCCGREYPKQPGNFYATKSDLYAANNHYVNICINCIAINFEETEMRTGSKRFAMINLCYILDLFYNEGVFDKLLQGGHFTIGAYLRALNSTRYNRGSFLANFLHNTFAEKIEVDDNKVEVDISEEDRLNKEFVTSRLGYDPFTEDYPSDRRFLFNLLSDYLTDDICDDPHKLQSVLSVARSLLQETKIDKMIDAELNSKTPNSEQLKVLTDNKEKIRRTINAIAKDNGLSDNGKSSKGTNTLTGIMREMLENNFEEVKTNVVTAKMQEVYKSISDISNQSLFAQLNLQEDDYARLLSEQRDTMSKLQEERMLLEEELRLAKKTIEELQAGEKS